MHDTWTIAIPTFAVILAALWNNSKIDKLETRVDAGFNAVNVRLDRMQSDLSSFNRELGVHDRRLDEIQGKTKA